MLFDINPKTKREDLFGQDYLLTSLLGNLTGKSKLIVLKGLRRTGKTSILKVALNESKLPFVLIDVRFAPYSDRKLFLDFLSKAIIKIFDKNLVNRIIKKISKVSIGVGNDYLKGTLDFDIKNESDFLTVLEEANKNKLILAFDEAQLLSVIEFDMIIASIYDNFPNIKIILTGSEIGLLEDFLGKGNNKAPLYGRLYSELSTGRFSNDNSYNFLISGFKQYKKNISSDEIVNLIDEFDGIVGWHNYYGFLRCEEKKDHLQALASVIEIGSKITFEEFERFLGSKKNRDKYIKILQRIMLGKNTWSKIKEDIKSKIGTLTDAQLNKYLKDLLYHGFIDKTNDIYIVSDPLLKKGLEKNIKF